MNVAPEGKFSVKIEFNDDSFELTDAIISKNGTFTFSSSKTASQKRFKMIFLSPEQELLEFLCDVQEVSGQSVTGRLSKLDH